MIQPLMNFIFFVIVAATVVGSFWLSKKYKERYAKFPWSKAGIVVAIEVIAWIIFNWLWNWVQRNPWIAAIFAVIIIIVLLKRKKKEEQVL